MGNVDKFLLTSDLLERCCVGVEAMRRKAKSDTAWRQDHDILKTDLERKLMENKCLDENKLEMSQALVVTKLQVSKNQLEQVAGITSSKGQDVEEEVKTLHIYRNDLIKELCDIDRELVKKAADIEGKARTQPCSKEEQADKEVLAGLKELSRHNLGKLKAEQKMLKDILEETQLYASSLLHYKYICEKQLAEAKKMGEEMEYTALSNQARSVTISTRKKRNYENVKTESMDMDCANDDDDDNGEVMLAEKTVVLESFQTMLISTLEVKRKLTSIIGKVEQRDYGHVQSKENDDQVQSRQDMRDAAKEIDEPRRYDQGMNVDVENASKDINNVIDTVIEGVFTKILT